MGKKSTWVSTDSSCVKALSLLTHDSRDLLPSCALRAAATWGRISHRSQRRGQNQWLALFSATALANIHAGIIRHALDSLCRSIRIPGCFDKLKITPPVMESFQRLHLRFRFASVTQRLVSLHIHVCVRSIAHNMKNVCKCFSKTCAAKNLSFQPFDE